MFSLHTDWAERPCFYVIAYHGNRRAWLAGPYTTEAEARAVLPQARQWAQTRSGDARAGDYDYDVYQHHHGHTRSILGILRP